MSRTRAVLNNPVGKQLASAAVAGVVTYLRPARIPKWARRSLLATNTAGAGAGMLLGTNANGTDQVGSQAPLAGVLGSRSDSAGLAADVLATATGGIGLLTSSMGLKADARIEQALLKRGVGHPRLVMAAGTVIVVFAVGYLTDRAARAAERKAAALQASPETEQLGPGVTRAQPAAGQLPPPAEN
ncbi:hypothetical protein ACMYYO_13520 [Dermacoccaceae bacterium W4C1]